MELGWTVIELQAAQQVGRPIDAQKYDGMQLKWNMDADEQVYIGDTSLGAKGLLNLDRVPVSNAVKPWAQSTPMRSGTVLTRCLPMPGKRLLIRLCQRIYCCRQSSLLICHRSLCPLPVISHC